MLSNAYFLAKIRFDTAENEPAKNLQKFCKILQNLPILLTLTPPVVRTSRRVARHGLTPEFSEDDAKELIEVAEFLPSPIASRKAICASIDRRDESSPKLIISIQRRREFGITVQPRP